MGGTTATEITQISFPAAEHEFFCESLNAGGKMKQQHLSIKIAPIAIDAMKLLQGNGGNEFL